MESEPMLSLTLTQFFLGVMAAALVVFAVAVVVYGRRVAESATRVGDTVGRLEVILPRVEQIVDRVAGDIESVHGTAEKAREIADDLHAVSAEVRTAVTAFGLVQKTRAAVAGAKAGYAVLRRAGEESGGEEPAEDGKEVHHERT